MPPRDIVVYTQCILRKEVLKEEIGAGSMLEECLEKAQQLVAGREAALAGTTPESAIADLCTAYETFLKEQYGFGAGHYRARLVSGFKGAVEQAIELQEMGHAPTDIFSQNGTYTVGTYEGRSNSMPYAIIALLQEHPEGVSREMLEEAMKERTGKSPTQDAFTRSMTTTNRVLKNSAYHTLKVTYGPKQRVIGVRLATKEL